MNNLLLQKNILTCLHWEPESLSHLQPAEQASFRGMMKANRRLVYSDASGTQALGYSTKISTLYEPLRSISKSFLETVFTSFMKMQKQLIF